ncbi:MAG: S8 family serine peptidase, partial [Candidatus Sumerlaeota bacterium]
MKSGNASRAVITSQENGRTLSAARALVGKQIEQKLPGRVTFLYETGKILNGIAVASEEPLNDRLAGIRGIVSATPMRLLQPAGSISVPFINVPPIWEGVDALQGAGMRIGIIDTGIDYLHRDFAGPGTGYAENNRTIIGDVPGFPGDRVVGGIDLVGDDYNPFDAAHLIPHPDADPMDCSPHGSQVASVAAGSGVNADGTTYRGAYNSSVTFASMRIAPGVAPKADVYAIKAFGCVGPTGVLLQAFEYAADPDGDGDFSDRLDAVNISLDERFASTDDIYVTAAENLSALGTIVVSSAGNGGDTYFVIGAPGIARSAISVAACMDDGIAFGEVALSSGEVFHAGLSEVGVPLTEEGVTAPVVMLLFENRWACDTLPPASVAGKIVVIAPDQCSQNDKIANAQAAGAVGVIIAKLGGTLAEPLRVDRPNVTIPAVSISQQDAAILASELTRDSSFTLSIRAAQGTPPTGGDTLCDFSSRGPALGSTIALKPDISAPGQSIICAMSGTGNESVFVSGTSYAAPHVAGLALLLREKYPAASIEELKARLMTTTTHGLTTLPDGEGSIYSPVRAGTGRVDALQALNATSYATNTEGDGSVALCFGRVTLSETTSYTRTARIVNLFNEPHTWNVSYASAINQHGVTITTPASVTVPANGAAIFPVTVDVSAGHPEIALEPSMRLAQYTQGGLYKNLRSFQKEESGILKMVPVDGGDQLRLPLYIAIQHTTELRMDPPVYSLPSSQGIETLTVGGTTISIPENVNNQPVVSLFEWLGFSAQDASIPTVSKLADVKNYGIRREPAGSIGDIHFGISTWAPWNTQNEVRETVDKGVPREAVMV